MGRQGRPGMQTRPNTAQLYSSAHSLPLGCWVLADHGIAVDTCYSGFFLDTPKADKDRAPWRPECRENQSHNKVNSMT